MTVPFSTASEHASVAHGPFTATNPDRCAQVLDRAREITSGDRTKTHGDKLINHQHIAAMWSAWLTRAYSVTDDTAPITLTAHDVAIMMILLKVARTLSGSFNLDDYVDAAGYAGVAAEVYSKDKRYGD